jgi:hypothetical protein
MSLHGVRHLKGFEYLPRFFARLSPEFEGIAYALYAVGQSSEEAVCICVKSDLEAAF